MNYPTIVEGEGKNFFLELVFYMLLKVEGKNIVCGTFGGRGSWKKGKKPEIVFK